MSEIALIADVADDLSNKEVEELHQILLQLRIELKEFVDKSEGGTKPVELDQCTVGRLSRIDSIQMQQMAKANREQHQMRLKQITQALRRIDDDDYGYCRRCEEPIGYPRLKARPESPFCLSCQGASEQRVR